MPLTTGQSRRPAAPGTSEADDLEDLVRTVAHVGGILPSPAAGEEGRNPIGGPAEQV